MANWNGPRSWQAPSKSGGLNKEYKAIAVLFIALCLIGALMGMYGYKSHELSAVDQRTFCAKDLRHLTVVLIDQTDPLNEIQTADLKRQLENIAANIPVNGMLKITAVTSDPASLLVSQDAFCNPGDANTVNSITGNKAIQELDYKRTYKQRIEKAVDTMFTRRESKNSPIMEAIQAVNVANFKGRDTLTEKRLIIVSDLLQNSSGSSFYAEIPDFGVFESSNFWPSIKSDFSNVQIDLLMLHRRETARLQNTRLKNFWRVYFTKQNSADPNFGDIDG